MTSGTWMLVTMCLAGVMLLFLIATLVSITLTPEIERIRSKEIRHVETPCSGSQ